MKRYLLVKFSMKKKNERVSRCCLLNITGKAAPYSFIGLADYVSHTDSKPMNIIWKMKEPIPAKYLRKTNKMIVG